MILLLWGVEGLVVLGAGLYPVSRPGPTVLQIALLMGALYGPMLWVGHATLNGHGGALWLGLLAFAAGLFVTLFGITGRAFDAEVWGQPHARFALFSLLLIMCFVGCVVHLVAIIANRVRRARQ
ncbi:MAG: hypothetical protein R6V12_06195 [Candidatus Hydrogenedentota bacterium]